jgi:hypothetical protein
MIRSIIILALLLADQPAWRVPDSLGRLDVERRPPGEVLGPDRHVLAVARRREGRAGLQRAEVADGPIDGLAHGVDSCNVSMIPAIAPIDSS